MVVEIDCHPSPGGILAFHKEHTMYAAIKTIREANKIAASLGLVRGKGTYNGAAYWKNAIGQIVTRERLAELAGLAS
ncbi:MAG: hypothetical protein IPN21_18185 [Burkholderiales bacterium]|nr:hypothetical protein [Burkholderiales bacterium]